MTLELYHWEPCADSAKVMICLHELGRKFSSHYVDVLALEQFAPGFLSVNPAGQVPVLVHDGQVLTESTLINEYLAETFTSASLAPGDPAGWYEVLCWGKYLDYNLGPSVSMLGWAQVMAPALGKAGGMPGPDEIAAIPVPERRAAWQAAASGYPDDQLDNSRRKIELATRRIDAALGSSPWLAGADYSIVDIDAFALMHTLPDLTPDIVNAKSTPNLTAWLEKIRSRPAVVEALSVRTSKLAPEVYAPGPEHSRWG